MFYNDLLTCLNYFFININHIHFDIWVEGQLQLHRIFLIGASLQSRRKLEANFHEGICYSIFLNITNTENKNYCFRFQNFDTWLYNMHHISCYSLYINYTFGRLLQFSIYYSYGLPSCSYIQTYFTGYLAARVI